MADNSYDVGDLVRVESTFTNPLSDNVEIDPTTVKCTITAPAGVETTYTYGVDAEVKKDATGQYYMDVDVNARGWWYYRWWSTGTGQAAEQKRFYAKPLNQPA